MQTEFFMVMEPPTVTAQEKKIGVRNGKPYTYKPEQLKDTEAKIEACLAQHIPPQPYIGGVRLVVKWCFPRGMHKNGEYRITPPDTDNLQKLLKDVMSKLGYWNDDSLVASEIIEKFWADIPGIYIKIQSLDEITGEQL